MPAEFTADFVPVGDRVVSNWCGELTHPTAFRRSPKANTLSGICFHLRSQSLRQVQTRPNWAICALEIWEISGLTNKQSVVNYTHIPFVYVRLSRYRGNIDEWDIFLAIFMGWLITNIGEVRQLETVTLLRFLAKSAAV